MARLPEDRADPRPATCRTRLSRPPVILTWSIAGIVGNVPLVLLSFFDWSARSVGALRMADVAKGFAPLPTLTLPQWFQLILIILWAALVVSELGCITTALGGQHASVLGRYRRVMAVDDEEVADVASNDEEAAVAAARDAALQRQRAHDEAEEGLARAGKRRHLAMAAAVFWIARCVVSVAAQIFNALGISAAPASNALLVRTVVACIGAISLTQLV